MTLGEAHLGLADAARATELLREAVELADRRGELTNAGTANVVLARVLLATDGVTAREEIEAALTHASELTDRVGTRAIVPTIHVELAELARQTGDAAGHERELHEAHRLFTEKKRGSRGGIRRDRWWSRVDFEEWRPCLPRS